MNFLSVRNFFVLEDLYLCERKVQFFMNISPVSSLYKFSNTNKTNDKKSSVPAMHFTTAPFELKSRFNDHLISFGARVDKGLDRFYEANKERMPITVSRYVDALVDKTALSPMEAQRRAFGALENAQSVKDIKKAFPAEELFQNLINPSETKATRGLLNTIKENEELLELYNQGVLKDKTNLTVYLVKKIFLEAKTIDEINKDLENDLDEDFKKTFKCKNSDKDGRYVYSSTLSALGIQLPKFEYQQSLRYTRDGYSDEVGDKISKSQREFWDSLSVEDRTARAKKSVEKFEIWWNSHTRNQLLDMIADQMTELEMLKDFKKQERANDKQNKTPIQPQNEDISKTRTKVGSEKLSKDELFIKWASNNLKLFEANLSEADKDTLHIKRMQRLAERWAGMSGTEKTDYISKMKSGAEPLRYTMIDAWNQSTNLLRDLSVYLKENQIYKPADLLYSTQEFSQFQSSVMTEFWTQHPDYAVELGNNIRKSQQKVQYAVSHGTFEEMKKQIMRDKNQRVKEMEKFKNSQNISSKPGLSADAPDYVKEFISVYQPIAAPFWENLPDEYISDFYELIEKHLEKGLVVAWTKNLKNETLNEQDEYNMHRLRTTQPEFGLRTNLALEAAIADTLYRHTKNPQVYLMRHGEAKNALFKLVNGGTGLYSEQLLPDRNFSVTDKKVKIDKNRLAALYHEYKEPLSDFELDEIVDNYFGINGDTGALKKYLKSYGKSLNIVFSEKSAFPKDVKKAYIKKIKDNLPKDGINANIYWTLSSDDSFEKEDMLKRLHYMYEKKYYFVPKNFIDGFYKYIAGKFRRNMSSIEKLEEYEKSYLLPRKKCTDRGKLALIPKTDMSTELKLKTLAMEAALADVLYEATDNIDVYKMQFEELCDNIEVCNLVKKFPSDSRTYPCNTDGQSVTISVNRKLNTAKIGRLFSEYLNEITDWVNNDIAKGGKGEFEDLLFILNPDEDMPEKDEAVSKRIKLYKLNLI